MNLNINIVHIPGSIWPEYLKPNNVTVWFFSRKGDSSGNERLIFKFFSDIFALKINRKRIESYPFIIIELGLHLNKI